MNKAKSLFSLGLIILLSACAPPVLNPGAKRVVVATQSPAKDCRYIKELDGDYGSIIAGQFIKTEDLSTGSLLQMRNAAQAAGANYVQLITKQGQLNGGFNYRLINRVIVAGKGYACPNLRINEGVVK